MKGELWAAIMIMITNTLILQEETRDFAYLTWSKKNWSTVSFELSNNQLKIYGPF